MNETTHYVTTYEDFYGHCDYYRNNGYQLIAYGEDYQVFKKDNHRVFVFVNVKEF